MQARVNYIYSVHDHLPAPECKPAQCELGPSPACSIGLPRVPHCAPHSQAPNSQPVVKGTGQRTKHTDPSAVIKQADGHANCTDPASEDVLQRPCIIGIIALWTEASANCSRPSSSAVATRFEAPWVRGVSVDVHVHAQRSGIRCGIVTSYVIIRAIVTS